LSRETKKALFYHAQPRPHGFDCEALRGKTKLFWSPGTIWPPRDKGEFQGLKSPRALFLTKRVPEVSKSVPLIDQKTIFLANQRGDLAG